MNFYIPVITHILEFVIAMNCLGDIMEEKLKKRHICLIGISLYAVAWLFFITAENVIVNTFIFIIINILFALLCFECTVKQAILCSFLLTVMMIGSEFIFIVGYSITDSGDINTYSSSLATYTIGVSLSKTLYFLLTKLVVYFGFSLRNKTPPASVKPPHSCFCFPYVQSLSLLHS